MAIKQFYIGIIHEGRANSGRHTAGANFIKTDLVNGNVGDFLSEIPDDLNENCSLYVGIMRDDGEIVPFVDGVVPRLDGTRKVMRRISRLPAKDRNGFLECAWGYAFAYANRGEAAEVGWLYRRMLPRKRLIGGVPLEEEPMSAPTGALNIEAESGLSDIVAKAAELRKDPPNSMGTPSVAKVISYLCGYEAALIDHGAVREGLGIFSQFTSYVAERLCVDIELGCEGMIVSHTGDRRKALVRFWELWDAFLATL